MAKYFMWDFDKHWRIQKVVIGPNGVPAGTRRFMIARGMYTVYNYLFAFNTVMHFAMKKFHRMQNEVFFWELLCLM